MTPAALRRGTVVTVASPGVYCGKPIPAVVVQTLPADGRQIVHRADPVLMDLDLALRGWLELP